MQSSPAMVLAIVGYAARGKRLATSHTNTHKHTHTLRRTLQTDADDAKTQTTCKSFLKPDINIILYGLSILCGSFSLFCFDLYYWQTLSDDLQPRPNALPLPGDPTVQRLLLLLLPLQLLLPCQTSATWIVRLSS